MLIQAQKPIVLGNSFIVMNLMTVADVGIEFSWIVQFNAI